MADDEVWRLDAVAQAELVRSGQVSPAELVEGAIARAEALNPGLNAIIHPRYEEASAEAAGDLPDGPLRGVPMVLKDLDGFAAGQPYHAGMAHLRDVGFTAPHDTELTARFRRMGAVVIGRTNTPELGLVPSTEPEAYGPVHNPWDLERSAAGSSGGSAASVASGIVPLGHAGDGGGSIRLPASVCGLVGLKPSRGRITVGPEAGEAWGGLVARLVVTRSVRDTAAVLDAVHGPLPGDPSPAPPPEHPYADDVAHDPRPLRIGWTATAPDPAVATDPEVGAVVAETARRLEALGHDVEQLHPAAWDRPGDIEAFTGQFITALSVWTAAELDHLGALSGAPVTAEGTEAGTWALAEMGRATPAVAYHAAVEAMHAYARDVETWWQDHDVLVTPTTPELPWTLGQFATTATDPLAGLVRSASIVQFTVPFNVTGQPAVSVPGGWSSQGLPLGVQLVGARHREDVVLALAGQLERAHPWADRWPLVHP